MTKLEHVLPRKIENVEGEDPPRQGWHKFLRSIELRDVYDGVGYYGEVNCNYVVFPDGTLVASFGLGGRNLMKDCRKLGVRRTLLRIKKAQHAVHASAQALCEALDRFTEALSQPLERRRKEAR